MSLPPVFVNGDHLNRQRPLPPLTMEGTMPQQRQVVDRTIHAAAPSSQPIADKVEHWTPRFTPIPSHTSIKHATEAGQTRQARMSIKSTQHVRSSTLMRMNHRYSMHRTCLVCRHAHFFKGVGIVGNVCRYNDLRRNIVQCSKSISVQSQNLCVCPICTQSWVLRTRVEGAETAGINLWLCHRLHLY
jgi:hypothetical protein